MSKFKKFFINSNILLLSIVSFLNDVSSEMIAPILPLFIKQLGGTGIAIGLIGGIKDGLPNVLKFIFGYWSDKIKKKRIFINLGYLSSGIFRAVLSFSYSWQEVLMYTSIERVGKAARSAPRDAFVAIESGKHVGKGFGILRSFNSLGHIIGSLAALIMLMFWHVSLRFIIVVAAVFAFISLIPLFFVSKAKNNHSELVFDVSKISSELRYFIYIATIFTLGKISYMFLILQAQEIIHGKASIVLSILLYVLFGFSYAIFAIPIGILSDKIGRWKVIFLGYLLFSITYLGFTCAQSIPILILLFCIYGIAKAIIDVIEKAYVSDLSTEQYRATALGSFYTTTGIVNILAGLVAGILWEKVSHQMVFWYAGILSIVGLMLLLIFKQQLKRKIPSYEKSS